MKSFLIASIALVATLGVASWASSKNQISWESKGSISLEEKAAKEVAGREPFFAVPIREESKSGEVPVQAEKPVATSSPQAFTVPPAIPVLPGSISASGQLKAFKTVTYGIRGNYLAFEAGKAAATLYQGKRWIYHGTQWQGVLDPAATYYLQFASTSNGEYQLKGRLSRALSYQSLREAKTVTKSSGVNFAKGSTGASWQPYLSALDIHQFTLWAKAGQTIKIKTSVGAAAYLRDETGMLMMVAVRNNEIKLPTTGDYSIWLSLLPNENPQTVSLSVEIPK